MPHSADPTEDRFTHYVPHLPFIEGHGGTRSRVISIVILWWGILSGHKRFHPGAEKNPSPVDILFGA